MNSCRRGLRNGVLVNPKLSILEKANFGPHTKCWSNLVKSGQTCCKLVLFGAGHYSYYPGKTNVVVDAFSRKSQGALASIAS